MQLVSVFDPLGFYFEFLWLIQAILFQVAGKIVVFDHTWVTYGVSNVYRRTGAGECAKRGAVAALVAAVSNQAMDLPHTGKLTFNYNVI